LQKNLRDKHLSFPHKELPTEEPLAVEAHVFIVSVPYAVALRIVVI